MVIQQASWPQGACHLLHSWPKLTACLIGIHLWRQDRILAKHVFFYFFFYISQSFSLSCVYLFSCCCLDSCLHWIFISQSQYFIFWFSSYCELFLLLQLSCLFMVLLKIKKSSECSVSITFHEEVNSHNWHWHKPFTVLGK